MRTTTMLLIAVCLLAGTSLLPGQVMRETLYETRFDTAGAVDDWLEVSGTWTLDPDAGTYTGSGAERILTVYDGPLADGSENSELRDYMISAELQRNNVAGGLAGRYMDAENYYLFRHHPDGQLQIYAIASAGNTQLGVTAFPNADLPERYVLRFEMIGTTLTGTLLEGETELASVTVEDDSFPQGAAGLRIWAAEQAYHDFSLVAFRFPEARSPNPPDGVVYEDIWANLTWQGGDFAVSHDVYIGTDFDAVNEATRDSDHFAANVTDTELMIGFPTMPVPGGLVPGTTYYWRVDAVNEADENSPWKGAVWSFQLPPTTAWKPQPVDGVEFVHPAPELSWARGWNAIFYTVYFGTDPDEVANAATGGIMGVETTFQPEPLEAETTYYWRVDLFNGTQTQKGDVWSFTTLPQIAVSDPNLVGWWTLDEGMGTTAVDWSGHGSHGTMMGEPQWVAGYSGGALSLDGVDDYVDIGAVGVSGAAPRTVAGWAKADRFDVTAWTNVFGLVGPASGTRTETFFTIQVMGATDTSTPGYYGLHRYGGQQDIIPIDLEWHHLAATYDGATAAWYGDGQLIGSEEITANTRDYVLMGKRSDNSNFFPGAIDDVRVY
ncbi:MAG: LamG domain-containing protein, partial [Sedimentisphaerales bacterium]|nr:LamG domain-containing protein [Sedimentisphaerales bacterium]